MGIRINKAIRELNIGHQTAVEFLKKRPDLGEVGDDLSFKLNEEQYKALVDAFRSDKEVRTQAEKLLAKHPKEKTRPQETKEQHVEKKTDDTAKQVFKPLGKIDLDSIGKKPAPKKDNKTNNIKVEKVEAPEKKATEPKPDKVTVEEVKPVVVPKPVVKETPKPVKNIDSNNDVIEKKKESFANTEPKSVNNNDKEDKTKSLFTLKSEVNLTPKVNVLGKIDLDSINQSTRPKKKSKEERRKEREEKAAQARPEGKKKRSRITKERVNIDQAVKQNNVSENTDKGNSKKKNRKRNHKPLEVNEEDVARQVKETLARLTSKGQNKKGAKYRKEKREAAQELLKEQRAEEKAESKTLKLTE